MATGNTFNAMVNQIVFELGQRTDLAATVIPRAINDAIQIYQKSRFRFNELQPIAPFTLNTVQGQSVYDVAADARIPLLYKIDYINYVLGTTVEKMLRETPENVYLALQTGQQAGPPQTWAWDGQSIVIYPTPPAQVYQLTIGGYLAVAGPLPADYATDTTNPWMNAAERLIRTRAKWEIACHVTRNEKMMAAYSPEGGLCEKYFDELLGEMNKIRGTSRIRAMPF